MPNGSDDMNFGKSAYMINYISTMGLAEEQFRVCDKLNWDEPIYMHEFQTICNIAKLVAYNAKPINCLPLVDDTNVQVIQQMGLRLPIKTSIENDTSSSYSPESPEPTADVIDISNDQ